MYPIRNLLKMIDKKVVNVYYKKRVMTAEILPKIKQKGRDSLGVSSVAKAITSTKITI